MRACTALLTANIFTATRYKGLDPEVSGLSIQEFGMDEGIYNNQRTFLAGITLQQNPGYK